MLPCSTCSSFRLLVSIDTHFQLMLWQSELSHLSHDILLKRYCDMAMQVPFCVLSVNFVCYPMSAPAPVSGSTSANLLQIVPTLGWPGQSHQECDLVFCWCRQQGRCGEMFVCSGKVGVASATLATRHSPPYRRRDVLKSGGAGDNLTGPDG